MRIFNPFTGKPVNIRLPKKSSKNRTKFSVENIVVEIEEGCNPHKKIVEAIKNVVQKSYDTFDVARETVKVGNKSLTVATQSPEGRSWYASQVKNKKLANYRIGWVYTSKGNRRDWLYKFGIVYMRQNDNTYKPVLKIVDPTSVIGFFGEPDRD